MIALVVSDIEKEVIEVSGEDFVHLASSLRVHEGDQVKLLDGHGRIRVSVVDRLEKRKLFLSGGDVVFEKRGFSLDLLLAPPKRDSLNDCLRAACELGVRRIYLFNSEYCQNKSIKMERVNKVLKSSLTQSNNPYLPEVIPIDGELSQIKEEYDKCLILHLGPSPSAKRDSLNSLLLAIGPEGGFSENDIREIESHIKNSQILNLKCPILRTQTAVSAAVGYAMTMFKI